MNILNNQPVSREIALEEMQAQQQLFVAVYHSLEKIMPSSLEKVEGATSDLAQKLDTLATLVTRQQELAMRMIDAACGQPITPEIAEQLRSEAVLTHDLINRQVSACATRLQFKDRHRQWMHDVMRMLEQCLPTQPQVTAPSMTGRHHLVAQARRVLNRIHADELRNLVTEIFENARMIPKPANQNYSKEESLL